MVPLEMNYLCQQPSFFEYLQGCGLMYQSSSMPSASTFQEIGIFNLKGMDALCIMREAIAHGYGLNMLQIISAVDPQELSILKQPWIQMSLWKELQNEPPSIQTMGKHPRSIVEGMV